MNAIVITVSDRSFRGERPDLSGPRLAHLLKEADWHTADVRVVPDDALAITRELIECADKELFNLVLTTGGTGAGPRDVTPEATVIAVSREFPGISELLRRESERHSKFSALSRGIAGSRGQTLIINLPGNPDATEQCWNVIAPIVRHACNLLAGIDDAHV
jgi:molybdenum cofactor synthesis domain-containing protein